MERRAAALCRMQIGRGSIVAIAHHGSAFFFADLFAVWTAGATAACLDGSLTEAELETIVHFARSAATDGAEAELVTDHVRRNRCSSRTKRKYVFIGETGS